MDLATRDEIEKLKKDLREYNFSEAQWNRLRLRVNKAVKDMEDDAKTAWWKPLVGAFIFAFGLFAMISMSEYEEAPIYVWIIGGLLGALTLGWGLYALCT
ncbi:MAG: hypothetical protein ACK4YO_02675 [Candidatus Altarchaeaceae archaeon]